MDGLLAIHGSLSRSEVAAAQDQYLPMYASIGARYRTIEGAASILSTLSTTPVSARQAK